MSTHAPDTFGDRFEHGRADLPEIGALAAAGPTVAPAPASHAKPSLSLPEAFLCGVLYILACLVGAGGVLGALAWLAKASVSPNGLAVNDLLAFGGLLIGGLAAAGGLVGLAVIVAGLSHQRWALGQVTQAMKALADRPDQPALMPRPIEPAGNVDARLDRLDALVRQVAQDCLLDEPGRALRRRQVIDRERDTLADQVRGEMKAGRWDRAGALIEQFRMTFPAETQVGAALLEELQRRRSQAEEEDVAAARQICDELMSVSSWDRALVEAQRLVNKHPESTAAKSLLARVDREHKLAQEQQRSGIYLQVQKLTARRDWQDALAAARQLLDRFPNSIEAEALRGQMDTLTANAEIQYRQSVERTIKDMVRRQRYAEAIALSEDLIASYPNSPQAAALREQLPKLRDLLGAAT